MSPVFVFVAPLYHNNYILSRPFQTVKTLADSVRLSRQLQIVKTTVYSCRLSRHKKKGADTCRHVCSCLFSEMISQSVKSLMCGAKTMACLSGKGHGEKC